MTILDDDPGHFMVDINPQYPSDELVDHVFSIEVSVPMNYPEASADFHISSIPLIESLDEVVEIIIRRTFLAPHPPDDIYNEDRVPYSERDIRKIVTWLEKHMYDVAEIGLEVDRMRQDELDAERKRREEIEEQNRIRRKREAENREAQNSSSKGKGKKRKQLRAKAEKIQDSSKPNSERLASKYTSSWDICYSFKKTGKCRAKNCKWRHHQPDK